MKLSPFHLERYFARHEFSAPYLLGSSDCESWRLDELVAFEPDAAGCLARLHLGYTESLGAPDLRAAVAGLYEKIDADHVLVHAGAGEAIFNFMNVALEPGDHVVVQEPCYQSLAEVARGIGAQVTPWRGRPETGWALDLGDLERVLTPRTRWVVVNFPHNPTGFLPTRAFLDELVGLSRRHGFRLFCDEVYRGLEQDPADRLPAAAELDEGAVSLGVMSKSFGLAGLRIGWIASRDARLLGEMARFKDYTTICNAAPSEFLATLALRHADAILARNLGIVKDNLALLDAFFSNHASRFEWTRPIAGPIAFPRLRGGRDADAFCADLVEKAGVMLLPGSLYGPEYAASFRLGFGRRNLPEALSRLEAHLKQG
ncbi:aminotransferase class I/II-fold pyridoxal phosphate-dependent enzyme [Myxococcota bacterium]|nr:aminotransferase class I/II-fold pyridoxal phosphate-dependent enzyme [Myxococcota bacterium]MBU1411091.1 aminotransferase class I/II-fold pyridoxal phosphate-dependent enzyme [Myxococcota bacterium]MBU1511743.1 aminotransferase class I/II-fold pyridoxal phosphate-dependent enzyme [Myxococcota bacterium]